MSVSDTDVPPAFRAHLAAVTGDAEALRDIWAPDGVLEFPYAAAVGARERLEGIDALLDYFGGARRFRDWSFTRFRAIASGDGRAFAVEFHGSATVLATGARYEQDYISVVTLDADGRIAAMREYWDPTRTPS